MSQIPINKKSRLSFRKIADDLKVNLRNDKSSEKPKQPSKKWLFLSVILSILIIYLGINYYFLTFHKGPFNGSLDQLFENAVAYAVVNQVQFYPQIASFNQVLQDSNFFGQGMVNRLNQYFDRAGLSFVDDIQPLFKDKLALMLLSANSDVSLPFLTILERKENLAKVSQTLNIVESEINKDFSISTYNYRQIKVTILDSLSVSYTQFLYTQIEEYLIISNSRESLEGVINFIIDSD